MEIPGEAVGILLFFIGMFGLIGRKNMILSIVAVGIMEVGVTLFFLTINASTDQVAPMVAATVAQAADPVPQALMITAIVIGIAVTAISLTMVINIHHKYGTANWEKAKNIRMEKR